MRRTFITAIVIALLVPRVAIAGPEKKTTSWVDYFRSATVAIGKVQTLEVKKAGGQKSKVKVFSVVGTGVIFHLPEQDPSFWLVTAKHVFFDPSEKWDPDDLLIRFSWFDETPVTQFFGIRVDLKKNGKRLWFPHPNSTVDLACLPLLITKAAAGREATMAVQMEDLATADEIYEGAPIIVLGYPGGVGPDLLSRAFFRQGITSWVSPSAPESSTILIDGNIFPGHSGGPVFKLPMGPDRNGNLLQGGRIAFLGIVSQAQFIQHPLIAGEPHIQTTDPQAPGTLLSPEFNGIAVIEPAARVRELLLSATRRR